MHWLYRIVPASRPRLYDPRILTWCFGNDEDGIFGERSGVETFKGAPPSVWQFVRWGIRNPAHNLTHHVVNWPGGPFWKWGTRPGLNGYVGFRPPLGLFGIAFRYEKQ